MMDTHIEARHVTAAPKISRCLLWLRNGWGLLRAAPLAALVLALLPMMVEAMLQFVPSVGMLLSKLFTPLAGMWALCVIHQRATTGAFAVRVASGRWLRSRRSFAGVALLSALVFAFQMLVVGLMSGMSQVTALLTLDTGALSLSREQIALMLVSGMLPALPLTFVFAQVVLSERSVGGAVRDSVIAVWRWRTPMLAFATLSAALLLALPWQPWLIVILLLLVYVNYAAWVDVFGHASHQDDA